MSEMREVSLETLGAGAAAELFNAELAKLIENVWDPNASPKTTRSVTLKVSVKPTEQRESAEVEIVCTSKLAPTMGVATQFFFGRRHGRYVAVEANPRQADLFDDDDDEGTDGARPRALPGGRDDGR